MSNQPVKVTVMSIHSLYDTRIANHLRTLLDEGYDVTYVNWSRGSQLPETLRTRQLHLVQRESNPAFGINAFRYLWMLCWFTIKCLQNRAALFHIHDLLLLPILPVLKLLTRARVVFDVHEHYTRYQGVMGSFARFCYACFLPAVDGLVGVAPSVLPTNNKPYVIVPNYQCKSDFQDCSENSTRNGRTRVVYFGSLSTETRDVKLMLDLAERCIAAFDNVEFHFGGSLGGRDGEECRTRFEHLAQSHPDQFSWFGLVPRDQVIQEANRADVGLWLYQKGLANIHGSQPNKIFEYLTVGAAIVATDGFAVADEIRRAGAGILVPPGVEADVLVGELKGLLSDQQRLAAMKAASAELGQKYSWEGVAVRYTELYRRIGVGR